jgi:O-methyltransferase involved in polyketide biosynthesis
MAESNPSLVNDDLPVTKTKITLTGAQETLLLTLSCKAKDAAEAKPKLGDKWATEVLSQVDYDFSRATLPPPVSLSLVLRTRLFDRWTTEFLAAHPQATVLHLACGLDARPLRLQSQLSDKVRWFDIDLPDVIELREKLLPVPTGGVEYHLIAGSAIDPSAWLDQIPTDRPTFIIMEGLTMYLSEDDVRGLIKSLLARFASGAGGPGGQIIFDGVNWFLVSIQSIVKPVGKMSATFLSSIDNPKEIETWGEGVKLRDEIFMAGRPGVEEADFLRRTRMLIMNSIPLIRSMGRDLRYDF